MKKFFLNVLSSFLGAWIAILFLGVAIVTIVFALLFKAGISSTQGKITKSSVLKLDLKGEIIETERTLRLDFNNLLDIETEKPQALDRIVSALDEAADNSNIQAVYLKCDGVSASPATLYSLRSALEKFRKESKKKVIAYGDSFTESDYFVASVADSIFINPDGNFMLTGVSASTPYMGSLFKKIGVDFQIAKVGSFKSAVEPYIMDEMSDPARAQLDTLCSSIWDVYKSSIGKSRKVSGTQIDNLVNSVVAFKNANNVKLGNFFSSYCYEREMDGKFASLLGVDKEDVNYVSPSDFESVDFGFSTSDDHIAVLYAVGDINEASHDGINCYDLVPVITELAEDDNVKGVVLRVNSPGGSVFGSEQIADALSLIKKAGKPFAVSMGDYAASGGYWISADADRIFASPLTVTGSIGIFGILPNATPLLNKVGVNIQNVSTNPNGFVSIPFTPLNETQMSVFTASINRGYDAFIDRVAKGRKMPESKVRAIAQGRVWDGVSALRIGLVDQLGSLDDAVKWVNKKIGGKKDLDVVTYPSVENDIFNAMLNMQSNVMMRAIASQMGAGSDMKMAKKIYDILMRNRLQARMSDIKITL